MKSHLYLALILFSSIGLAASTSDRCAHAIQNHLKEAQVLNRDRLMTYAKWSHFQSVPLSSELIMLEGASLPLVKKLDRQSQLYHRHDIGVLCDDVVSMKLTPKLDGLIPPEDRPHQEMHFNAIAFSLKLNRLIKMNQYDQAYLFLKEKLEEIENEPQQLCLTRHFLESMARSLALYPRAKDMSLKAGLADPEPIIKKFLLLQNRTLFIATDLDHRSFSLHQRGIPIFCRDVPPIVWREKEI